MTDAQKVKIKSWDYIQSHADVVNPVPEMEPFCGKEATIVECVVPQFVSQYPAIYSIFEDEGKFMWSQDWFENIEEEK